LRAGADDAGLLGFLAHHEAVDVLKKDDRDPGLITVHDEARGLIGAVDVDDSSVLKGAGSRSRTLPLVGHNPDGDSSQTAVAANERLTEFRLVFVKGTVVKDAGQDLPDIVFLATRPVKYLVDVRWLPAGLAIKLHALGLGREHLHQAAKALKTGRIIRLAKI